MYIFTYGSLMNGLWNNYLIEKARFVSICKTSDKYALYVDNHVIPKMVREERYFVCGELYETDDLKTIDLHEGYLYTRRQISVADKNGQKYMADCYISTDTDGELLTHGNYKNYIAGINEAKDFVKINDTNTMSSLLYVYGTLMSGMCNHDVIQGHKIGDAVTKNKHGLYVSGSIPFLHENGEQNIKGELYECYNLDMIDTIESNGEWYNRRLDTVIVNGVEYLAWIYFNEGTGEFLGDGDFRVYIDRVTREFYCRK